MNRNVLVVAAHTDDEALGCGGTIARHVSEGDSVYVVYMADGVSSRQSGDEKALSDRESAAEKAQAILKMSGSYSLGFPDNRMDSVPLLDIVQALEKVVAEVNPDVIYTHHVGDLNIDHQITSRAVMTACRPLPGALAPRIYSFETLSASEWSGPESPRFSPNYFVDISDFLGIKMEALNAYDLEMRPYPHARSMMNVESLACYRGASVGVHHAEAFMLIREIV